MADTPTTELPALTQWDDPEYASGGWYRCVLADGRVVWIGGCGECGTPWLSDKHPGGTLVNEAPNPADGRDDGY